MKVSFSYEKKQVLDGLRNHFFGRPEIRTLAILINVFALLAAALFYFNKIQGVSFLLFSVLWFLLWMTLRVFLPASIYRRSQTFKDHFTMDITENGMILHTERGDQQWNWHQFEAYKETLYFFHLYFDARSFFLIPKDAFESIMDQQQYRDWLKEKVKK